jgi:thiamine pyrophosphate-dependent acetolactate synthase large subunit-like protein
MLDKYACLARLASRRRDEIVVTTMSLAMPWMRLSDGPLDFAAVDSAMGHALGLGHGLALAQPRRRVLVLNGDGSTLMGLSGLVTLAQRPVPNLTLVIAANGTYEVTGNQPVPGAGLADFAALARAAGLAQVCTLADEAAFEAHLPLHLAGPGPRVYVWKLAPAREPVPRHPVPIRERAARLRQALLG